MPHILTTTEQHICEQLIADPLYCSDEIGADPQEYMQPIAEFLKRGEITDAEKIRLADQLIYRFFGDIKNAVAEQDAAADALIAEEESRGRLERSLGMGIAA